MKTIIAGSRGIWDYWSVERAVTLSGFQITEVVSGCARGVDRNGEAYAAKHGIPVALFPADWANLGKRAGQVRNCEMAEYAEALVAVWDGSSRGTKHMIDTAKAKGLKVYVFRMDAPPPATTKEGRKAAEVEAKLKQAMESKV
jgi:glycerophosphoryl diester phosphodiesterase